MDQQVEKQVRARAHAIWEAEGRPDGRELAHWEQAARELAAEGAEEAQPPVDPGEQGETVAPTAAKRR